MLRHDVVAAVEKGNFSIYSIKTIDEGIEILTGVKAGHRKKDGAFPEGTVNFLVDQELDRLAKSWKTFSAPDKKG